jgi:hypothetical protein
MQAIIMQKWLSHARYHLLIDASLYVLLMVLFIANLSVVGLTMGRTIMVTLPETSESQEPAQAPVTARSVGDGSMYGVLSSTLDVVIAAICFRNLWYVYNDLYLSAYQH